MVDNIGDGFQEMRMKHQIDFECEHLFLVTKELLILRRSIATRPLQPWLL